MNFVIYDEDEWRKIWNDGHKYYEDFEPVDTNTCTVTIEMAEIGDPTRYYTLSRTEWETQGGE